MNYSGRRLTFLICLAAAVCLIPDEAENLAWAGASDRERLIKKKAGLVTGSKKTENFTAPEDWPANLSAHWLQGGGGGPPLSIYPI
jgi:hypothetical protein